ncbi:major capsid protein [Stenotrophomonas phage Summit]|nr:major capsid protein [Stenotrophomonas phage Summit]
MRNQDLIKKADLALADLANGGLLLPEQNDRFIRTLIDQPTILSQVRTVAMNSPERKINKIGFGSRILRPAVSATPLTPSQRAAPDLGQITLTTKEVIAEVRIPYDVMEDNIERGNVGVDPQSGAGGLHQTIVDLMAERAALDLEELAIKGDTASADTYLALQNGYLKLAAANVVAAGGGFNKDTVKAGIKAMPDKYLRNRAAMKHFISIDNETELRDQYAARSTALGDSNLTGNNPLFMFGSRVEGAPMMPSDSGLFTHPDNLIFGIQRNVMMEYDKDITSRVFIIVLTARVAFAIEEPNAVVKYTGIVG